MDERLFIGLRDSQEYANKIEKLRRYDSNFALKIDLRDPFVTKIDLIVWGYSHGECLSVRPQIDFKYKAYTVVKEGNLAS